MGQINCQWQVPHSFVNTSKILGPPIPTITPIPNVNSSTTHNNNPTNHRTTTPQNTTQRQPNKAKQPKQKPHQQTRTKPNHPKQSPPNQSTPHSNRSKKRGIEQLKRDSDKDDIDFKHDPRNEYYISNDFSPSPHKKQRQMNNGYQTPNIQHDFVMHNLNQHNQIPSIYTQAFTNNNNYTRNNDNNKNINQIDHGNTIPKLVQQASQLTQQQHDIPISPLSDTQDLNLVPLDSDVTNNNNNNNSNNRTQQKDQQPNF